jgi:hypothetical protein
MMDDMKRYHLVTGTLFVYQKIVGTWVHGT